MPYPYRTLLSLLGLCLLSLQSGQAYSNSLPLNYANWRQEMLEAIGQITTPRDASPQVSVGEPKNNTREGFSKLKKTLLRLSPAETDWILVFVQGEMDGIQNQEILYMIAERFNEIADTKAAYQVIQEYQINTNKTSQKQLASLLRNSSNPEVLAQIEKFLPSLIRQEDQKNVPLIKEISLSLCRTQEASKIESLLTIIAEASNNSDSPLATFDTKKPYQYPEAAGLSEVKSELVVPILYEILAGRHPASQSMTVKLLSLTLLKQIGNPLAQSTLQSVANGFSDDTGAYAKMLLGLTP